MSRKVYFNNFENQNSINEKIYNRNIPSANLQPVFNFRPECTKYVTMPIVNSVIESNTKLYQYPSYSVTGTFNPGNAPWSGFNIDIESQLKNQFFALQKSDQGDYIPSSTSELYKPPVFKQNDNQTHSMLFETYGKNNFNANPFNLGQDLFNNPTRQQLKNIGKERNQIKLK